MDEIIKRQIMASLGVPPNLRPLVRFFDHAVADTEATAKSGRPRFKEVTYIEKRPRNSDVRDVFHRAATPSDQREFAAEWEAYTEAKKALTTRAPALQFIPGMNVAAYEELMALELTDCAKLAAHEGDLENLEPFRRLAKKALELAHGNVPEERQDIPAGVLRPLHSEGSGSGAGSTEAQTFSYSFQVA